MAFRVFSGGLEFRTLGAQGWILTQKCDALGCIGGPGIPLEGLQFAAEGHFGLVAEILRKFHGLLGTQNSIRFFGATLFSQPRCDPLTKNPQPQELLML